MSSTSHVQSGIQVAVVPSQSAFFAGETFSVSITFTNTRTSEPTRPQPRSASFTPLHRRGVHSVSSVPLAKPPTSPRSPQTANAFTPTFPTGDEGTDRKRKGLVGRKSTRPRVHEIVADEERSSKRKARATKASSISLTPSELVERLGGKSAISSPHSRDVSNGSTSKYSAQSNGTPVTGRSVDAKLPLPPSHPHARKDSVDAFQVQEVTTPSFSVSLESIAEVPGPVPLTPFMPSPSPDPTSSFGLANGGRPSARHERGPPARGSHSRTGSMAAGASTLGLGRPTTGSGQSRQPRSAFSSTFSPPGTEVLLWAYAKLTGTVEFDESVISPSIVDSIRDRFRAVGSIGGGSMDIGAPVTPSGGLFSSFLPQLSPRSPPQRHKRGSSLVPGFSAFSLSSLLSVARLPSVAASPLSNADECDLPTLDLRPSILVVDLALTPGESRTYNYKVTLPSVLPPTFRGRALKFSYELVLGTSHAPSSSATSPLATPSPEQQRKMVMKIPIRLYNFVSVQNPSSCYEILWPLQQGKETSSRVPSPERRPTEDDDDDEEFSCREAVEILTRNSRKVSYDIHKDGDKVAVLTLTKSSYRLGETVMGIVEINNPEWLTRVLKFSAFLEAHERVPASFMQGSKGDLRRVHAEYHSSITPNTLRTPFTLDVPSDGSPAFEFSAATVGEGKGGLEWRVRLCFLVAAGGKMVKHLVHEEHEDEWGSAWRAAPTLAPLALRAAATPTSVPPTPLPGAWSELFGSIAGERVRDEDGGDAWVETGTETVECEIGVRVYAANTVFQPVETVFRA